VIAWSSAQSDIEICADLSGMQSLVTRRASGIGDDPETVKAFVNRDQSLCT